MGVVALGAAAGAAGFASADPTPTPPSSGASAPAEPGPGGRGHGSEDGVAKALAPKLGVDEATITTALDEIRAAHEADRTKALDDRPASAVQAGTLTQAEADAAKKAAEKGVIGYGPR